MTEPSCSCVMSGFFSLKERIYVGRDKLCLQACFINYYSAQYQSGEFRGPRCAARRGAAGISRPPQLDSSNSKQQALRYDLLCL